MELVKTDLWSVHVFVQDPDEAPYREYRLYDHQTGGKFELNDHEVKTVANLLLTSIEVAKGISDTEINKANIMKTEDGMMFESHHL